MPVITQHYQNDGLLSEDIEVVFFHWNAADVAADVRIPIPFKGKLIGGETFITDMMSASTIDIEADIAGGTEMFNFVMTNSAAVGTKVAGTKATGVANKDLIIDNGYVNAECATDTAAGSLNLYLFFDVGSNIEIA